MSWAVPTIKLIQSAVRGYKDQVISEWEDPQFREFLASRDIDGLLELVGIDNSPWTELYELTRTEQTVALRELLSSLASKGVEATLFKGAELIARFFPRTPLGFLVDVDVIVPAVHIQTVKAVLYELGYTQSYFDVSVGRLLPRDVRHVGRLESTHYELAPFCKELTIQPSRLDIARWVAARQAHPIYTIDDKLTIILEIDVHHNVATDTDIVPLLSRQVESRSFPCFTLSDADHLWVNCTRQYNEVALHAKRSLRAYLYTAKLLQSDNLDWDIILRAAVELDLHASLYYPLRTLEVFNGGRVPIEVLAALHPRLGTEGARDFGWQLGPLLDFVEPIPVE